jgi:hypothetical protein
MSARTGLAGVLVAAGLVWSSGPMPVAARGIADRNERSILVTVVDKDGNAIRDLRTGDVAVREDGVLREVIDVAPATDPLYLAVLIDTGKPRMGQIAQVGDLRKGLMALVRGVQTSSPDSPISLTDIGGAAVRAVDFTTKADDLEKHIGRLFPGQRPGAVLLEGLLDAAGSLKTRPSPRRAIVSITLESPETSTRQPRDVAEAVQKAGASYWAVSVEPPPDATIAQTIGQSEDPSLMQGRAMILASLPTATGGLRLTSVSTSALESMCRKVASALTAQYVVTYATPATRPATSIQPTSTRGARTLMAPWVQ